VNGPPAPRIDPIARAILRFDDARPSALGGARLALGAMVLTSLFALSGCTIIEGIFKAGIWVGVVAIVAVIVIAGGIAAMLRS
jgi:hypothetical protein